MNYDSKFSDPKHSWHKVLERLYHEDHILYARMNNFSTVQAFLATPFENLRPRPPNSVGDTSWTWVTMKEIENAAPHDCSAGEFEFHQSVDMWNPPRKLARHWSDFVTNQGLEPICDSINHRESLS